MIPRQPLKPNNRSVNSLRRSLASGASKAKFPKGKERPSIFAQVRPSQQAQDGWGGGYRIP